jgi:hypothetical protein
MTMAGMRMRMTVAMMAMLLMRVVMVRVVMVVVAVIVSVAHGQHAFRIGALNGSQAVPDSPESGS